MRRCTPVKERPPFQALLLLLGALLVNQRSAHAAWSPVLDASSIRRTQYEVDDDITLTFDPKTLRQSGAWVTVSWQGVQNPGHTDFIAAYSPASVTPSTRAPIKFQYASTSSNHMDSGQGTVAFRLVNLRADYSFAYFRGNLTHPVFVAVSEPIRFAVHAEPLGVHLALTSDPTEMRVTWKSAEVVGGARPEVHFYQAGKKDKTQVVRAVSYTYGVDDLCGEPARSVGYHEPGLIYTAVMTGLLPRTMYNYRVGDAGLDVWSDTTQFVSSPGRGGSGNSNQKVMAAIFADMSMAELDGSLQAGYFSNDWASLNTSRYLQLAAQETGFLDAAVCIGDLSYATGFMAHWDSWLDQVEPVAKRVPFMVAPGNHERDDPSTSSYHDTISFYHNNEGGGECGVPYSALFPMPGPAEAPRNDMPWYSFDLGPVHFTVASTEHDFLEGSPQYHWLARDLASVDRAVTPWLVFMGHRPLYLDSTDDSPDPLSPTEQAGARLLRSHLEPLLMNSQVDLVLAGHHHSYQRTCKLYDGKCLAPTSYQGTYQAPVYAVIGMGGRRLSTNFMPAVPSYYEYMDGKAYGVTLLEADRTELSFTFIDVSNGQQLDHFTLHLPKGVVAIAAGWGVGLAWTLVALVVVGLLTALCCPGWSKQLLTRIVRSAPLVLHYKSDSPPQTEMSILLGEEEEASKRHRVYHQGGIIV